MWVLPLCRGWLLLTLWPTLGCRNYLKTTRWVFCLISHTFSPLSYSSPSCRITGVLFLILAVLFTWIKSFHSYFKSSSFSFFLTLTANGCNTIQNNLFGSFIRIKKHVTMFLEQKSLVLFFLETMRNLFSASQYIFLWKLNYLVNNDSVLD